MSKHLAVMNALRAEQEASDREIFNKMNLMGTAASKKQALRALAKGSASPMMGGGCSPHDAPVLKSSVDRARAAKNLPPRAVTSTMQLLGQHDGAASSSPQRGHTSASLNTATATAEDDQPSQRRHAHRRRKHKLDCPKHMLNQKKKGQPLDPELAARATDPDSMRVPRTVGRGLSMFLTGMYDDTKWTRRPNQEHPDFRKVSDDAFVNRGKQQSVRPTPALINPVTGATDTGAAQLVKDPLDQKHCRRKHDLKSYMEAMYQMGTALLRK